MTAPPEDLFLSFQYGFPNSAMVWTFYSFNLFTFLDKFHLIQCLPCFSRQSIENDHLCTHTGLRVSVSQPRCVPSHTVGKLPFIYWIWGFLDGSVVKNLPTTQEMQKTSSIPVSGRSPGGENGNPPQYPCLKKIPWTEETGGLQSKGSQRDGLYWVTKHTDQQLGM